jgi:hypothetical protein
MAETGAVRAHVQDDFVCVECGLKSEEVYKEFKGGSFKLCICVGIL